ncbi:dynein axonemal intermediate chain 3 [Cylas formicarius]|uniref:dynein axonemal intermediate chain 3 n=1 Tax=Cylas formicarius TaxID=197179 RepID=UPI002958C2BF|nr:dynein axonemal intermediate chain 3 [Cylas formicarius]
MTSMGSELEVEEEIVKNQRALLEVEVEAKYPIFPHEIRFRIANVDRRPDGYVELKNVEPDAVTARKRIDNYTQVAPRFVSVEAQTTCAYPKNWATQYLYDVGDVTNLLEECEPNIILYARGHCDNISDLLRANGSIDLYADDFALLVKDPSTAESSEAAKEFVEYMSFMDVNLCKDKMIADIEWHRMWSGIVAIAYADIAPNTLNTGPNKEDLVYKAVHGSNPVLLWSFVDGLKPKLILESPREVHSLSFCSFDENILVGGCKNGQLVLWDIRNKLQKVEEKEVLTSAQQKYRNYMHMLMGWMKDVRDIAVIRPAAVSDLRYSHKAAVTGITWLHPYYEFSNMGKLNQIEEDSEDRSMQLLTSSLDGSVLIWDLYKKPVVDLGGYRPRKLRRLKRRPSALEMDVSPFKILHLNLKPIYQINVPLKDNASKSAAITQSYAKYAEIKYEKVNSNENRRFRIKERVIHRAVFERRADNLKPNMVIGTVEGEYAEISWQGQDFDSGETVNSEMASYLYDGRYHDGPVVSIDKSSSSGATLTVGGKVFALWRNDLPGRPILWRKGTHTYTTGEWNIFQSFKIVLHSISGSAQKWIPSLNSREPIFTQMLSNSYMTDSGIHPFRGPKNVYGIGDTQGAFRIFSVPQSAVSSSEELLRSMKEFIDREVARKKLFTKWQDEYNQKHKVPVKKETPTKDAITEEETDEREIPVKRGPQPGKYIEWVKEQRRQAEEARIKATIITKKQLDTKELEKRRKPLQQLDEENERKKRKQKQRLKEGEHIFRDTVASLFPDAVKEKPALPLDPYGGGDPTEDKERCYASFHLLSDEARTFMQSNPLDNRFDFRTLILEARKRQQMINTLFTRTDEDTTM